LNVTAAESGGQASQSTSSSGSITVNPFRPRPYRPKCNTGGL
jgi:hypothetical protein